MPERSLVSLTTMITCYSKLGDLDGARLLFDAMEEKDVVCWNDSYTQHGRPLSLWGTLLGGCRLHGNTKLGEKISLLIKILQIQALVHIYAASGNFNGVAKVRALMKGTGVQKEPGCISIEVNNRLHELLAVDLRHPNSKEIYKMLVEMNRWLKAHGYVPQADMLLHDIGGLEKKRSLEVHSQKLAIAFGLISTQLRATIKIVKNLRAFGLSLCDQTVVQDHWV